MLAGAGLSRLWPHDRAHWFFSRARWSADELGLAAARLVVSLLVPTGEPVTVAIDDTLFRRRGKKVWAASWFHDGSAPGPAKTGYGNNWVIAAVVVRLPTVSRPVAIPVLAKLVIKGTSSASRLWLARRMAGAIAATLPGRDIHVVADSAYAGGELKKLPAAVTWTTRLRKDAALHGLPPGPRRPAACGPRSSAPGPSLSSSSVTGQPAGMTWPWSPPIPLRHQPGSRAVRRQVEHRSRDRGRPAGLRRRAGPQPHRPRRRADRPVPARLPGHRHLLVRHRRPRPADVADHRAHAPWYTSKAQP